MNLYLKATIILFLGFVNLYAMESEDTVNLKGIVNLTDENLDISMGTIKNIIFYENVKANSAKVFSYSISKKNCKAYPLKVGFYEEGKGGASVNSIDIEFEGKSKNVLLVFKKCSSSGPQCWEMKEIEAT